MSVSTQVSVCYPVVGELTYAKATGLICASQRRKDVMLADPVKNSVSLIWSRQSAIMDSRRSGFILPVGAPDRAFNIGPANETIEAPAQSALAASKP